METGWIAAFALILFDIFLALVGGPLVTRRYTKQIVSEVWNSKVELQDLNGEVIKVPVVTKNAAGEEVTTMVVGPLWYTVLYGAGSMAAQHVKMALLSEKGKISRKLNDATLTGSLVEAGLSAAESAIITSLPRRAQGPALALMSLLKGPGTAQGARPGGKGGPI